MCCTNRSIGSIRMSNNQGHSCEYHSFFNILSFLLLYLGNIKEEMSDNTEILNHIVENLSLLSLGFSRETFQVSSLNKDLSTLSDLINVLSEKEVGGLVFKEDLQVFVGVPVLNLLIDCGIFLCQLLLGPSRRRIEDHFDCSVEGMWEPKQIVLSSKLLDVLSCDETLEAAENLPSDRLKAYQQVPRVARLPRWYPSSSSEHSSFCKGVNHLEDEWVE